MMPTTLESSWTGAVPVQTVFVCAFKAAEGLAFYWYTNAEAADGAFELEIERYKSDSASGRTAYRFDVIVPDGPGIDVTNLIEANLGQLCESAVRKCGPRGSEQVEQSSRPAPLQTRSAAVRPLPDRER